MYTDGVTDACDDKGMRFGAERLRAVLDAQREQPAAVVVDSLSNAIDSFQVGPHADDVAILAIRYISADVAPDDRPTTRGAMVAPAGASAND
jgi:serine phosphatase RsbU (regulator of sigma subunit)